MPLLECFKGQCIVIQENQPQYFTSEMCLKKRGSHFILASYSPYFALDDLGMFLKVDFTPKVKVYHDRAVQIICQKIKTVIQN